VSARTCPSKHWSLPAPCVLAAGHREIWHEAQFANGRIRFRRVGGVFATELLRDGEWRKLLIAPPETPETEVERLQARIAELENERHSTNEEMSKAVEDLHAKDGLLAAVRDAVAEAIMCGDRSCLTSSHLPKLERILGDVGLLPAEDRAVTQ
jgi:hypothetical protein